MPLLSYVLHLDDLKRAGIVPDWRTVYRGWQGFVADAGTFHLPTSAVQQFARDSFGTGDPETDYHLVRVLDADPSLRGLYPEETRLELLAARFGVAEHQALRNWQYALLNRLARKHQAAPSLATDDYYSWCYDFMTTLTDIKSIAPGLPLPDFAKSPFQDPADQLTEWLFWQAASNAFPAD